MTTVEKRSHPRHPRATIASDPAAEAEAAALAEAEAEVEAAGEAEAAAAMEAAADLHAGADRGAPAPDISSGVWGTSRTIFRYANRFSMVPIHRAGLAAWLGSPLTGCQMLLTTIGRKSGLPRPTPVGYMVAEGAAWVLAGYGPKTLWYRNLLTEPRVEILLPARPPMPATATEVTDPAVRARIIPALVRSMALPGRLIGTDPLSASDDRLLELTSWVPLIAIRPDGPPLVVGPDDPGGYGWVWRTGLATLATLLCLRTVWRWLRR